MLRVTTCIYIAEAELHERFVQAGGPGGQNVNKVASAVQLRFAVATSPSLPVEVRERLLRQASARINRAGELMIDARRYRSQERNRADARQRLARWIVRAAQTPKPRKPTRPGQAARKQRMQDKKQRARQKTLRRTPAQE